VDGRLGFKNYNFGYGKHIGINMLSSLIEPQKEIQGWQVQEESSSILEEMNYMAMHKV